MEIVDDGGSFCIFPEGRRSPDGTIQPAKGGVAYLAEYAGVPIVPVGFSGTFHTPVKDFFLRRRRITVRFGRPIHQAELLASVSRSTTFGGNVYKEEAAYVMGRVKELLD